MIFSTSWSTNNSVSGEEEPGVDDSVLEGFDDDTTDDELEGESAVADDASEDEDEETDEDEPELEDDADEVVLDSYDDQDDI